MKKLLSLLLAYLFLYTESYALSGGPVFGGGTSGVTIGTYAGVLTPNSAAAAAGANALGIFSLGVPQTNIASGNFVYFSAGETYVGTIIGVADPDALRFQGLVKAQFNINAIVANSGTAVPVSVPGGYANGTIDTDIRPGEGFGNSATVGRIEGTSTLTVQRARQTPGLVDGAPVGVATTIFLDVDGFKQSATADVTADLAAFGLTATTGAGA